VFSLGLALGALRRYVFAPLAMGALTKGAERHLAQLDAARASRFAIRQLQVALRAAIGIRRLRTLAPDLSRLSNVVAGIGRVLARGRVPARTIGTAQLEAVGLLAGASARGYPVKLLMLPLF
jgi:hypothetical protein